ncbi:hypothetical protein EON65_55935 [archaeon]|nr:MAG: hypothetical protein EON65_55935 [archaeon]
MKLSQEDEITMSQLLAQAEDSKARELVAKSKAEEATSIVNQLNLELVVLKRRLHALESERAKEEPNIFSVQHQIAMTEEADLEVEAMFQKEVQAQVPRNISERVLNDATPFERWKMNQFLYSTDTPAASKDHDSHVVDLLIDAATAHLQDSLRKPTASYVGKMKRGMSIGDLHDMQADPLSPLSATSPIRRTDKDFFLSDGLEQNWGARSRLAPPPTGDKYTNCHFFY